MPCHYPMMTIDKSLSFLTLHITTLYVRLQPTPDMFKKLISLKIMNDIGVLITKPAFIFKVSELASPKLIIFNLN